MCELFYEIAHEGSAAARRLVVERGLLGKRVRFRNLYFPEVHADYMARGGQQLPALWDGHTLVQGEEAVLAALRALPAR